MKVTHDDIARQAGVSRVAVSQVLNKSRHARISLDKRREIMAISKELGYQPRNLTTHAIGYVMQVDVMGIEAEVQTLKELQIALSASGYRLVLANLDDAPAQLRQTLNAKTVDGVVFSQWRDGAICGLLPPEVPFVVAADFYRNDADVDQVRLDMVQAVMLVTVHLIEQGHQRICFVTGLVDISVLHRAKEGFYTAFEAAGVSRSQGSLIEISEARDIAPLLDAELKREQPPTAIIGLEFVRTTNVVNHLQSQGYRIPEDISVASVLDSPNYEWLRPFITSTAASGKQTARHAAKRLLEKIEKFDLECKEIIIPTELIRRDSVCPPKTTEPNLNHLQKSFPGGNHEKCTAENN